MFTTEFSVSAGDLNVPSELSRDDIIAALQSLSDELGRRGIKGEICLFGGAVMVLAFDARLSTRDVDAIFKPAQAIREIAETLAADRSLPKSWLNDGVKGFVFSPPPLSSNGLPQFSNLLLTMPTAEYLLAMKCMAGRTGEGTTDLGDIIFLIQKLGLNDANQVLDIVSKYYGKSGVPIRTQFLVEGLFEDGKV